MENKRPLGVKIFLVALVYFIGESLRGLSLAIKKFPQAHSLLIKDDPSQVGLQNFFISHIVADTFQILVLSIIIIGVFRSKRWGYYFLMTYAAISIGLGVIFLFTSGLWKYEITVLMKHFQILYTVLQTIFFIGLAIYFCRHSVREIFITQELQKDKAIQNWSDALIVLSYIIVNISVHYMIYVIKYKGITFNMQALAYHGWAYHLIFALMGLVLLSKKEVVRRAFLGFCCFSIYLKFIAFSGSPMILLRSVLIPALYIIILMLPKMRAVFIQAKPNAELPPANGTSN